MTHISAFTWALLAFCIFAEAAREVCFKLGAKGDNIFTELKRPVVWLGIVFWGAELVAWVLVLERTPLSIAFPIMALSYVAIVLAGAWIFREKINFRHGLGAACITLGVACVGATGV